MRQLAGLDPFDEDISLGEGEDEDNTADGLFRRLSALHGEDMEDVERLPDVPSFAVGGTARANPSQDATSNERGDISSESGRREEATNPLTATFQRLRRVVRGMRTSDAGDQATEQRVEERAEEEEEEANAEDDDGDNDDDDGIDRSITVLNLAASQGGIEVLNILLDLGATAQDTALHDTVNYIGKCILRDTYSENVRMPDVAAGMACLEALLDAGVDVNSEHPVTQWTPLHLAADQKCHEVLSLLLERGADPGKRNIEGQQLRK